MYELENKRVYRVVKTDENGVIDPNSSDVKHMITVMQVGSGEDKSVVCERVARGGRTRIISG
jgi:hypothetical protein